MLVVGAYVRTPYYSGLFNAKTKNMAWDIFRHDFQSCGRTMERKSLLFHVKASFDPPVYLVKQ